MAGVRFAKVTVAVLGSFLFACAHAGTRGGDSQLSAGKYAVESIRSRAQLDGVDRVIEISEDGTRLVDPTGAEHVLTERGALLLSDNGLCRLALAVSVDGEAPGISDRACTWTLDGDHFLLGDVQGGTRTVYSIRRNSNRVILEGVSDVDDKGNIVGDASGERIILVERAPVVQRGTIDRVSEEQAVREMSEQLHDL